MSDGSTVQGHSSQNATVPAQFQLNGGGNSLVMTTWLWRLFPPLILLAGTFGNVATVGILCRMAGSPTAERGRGRGSGGGGGGGRGGGGRGGGGWSTMNTYLLALVVCDLTVLYAGLLRYWLLEVFGVDVFSAHDALCKVGMWLFGTAYNNATYLLVALTLQRTFSVLWPHRVHVVCTHASTRAVIAGTTVCSFLLLSHVPYGFRVVPVMKGTAAMCGHGSAQYSEFSGKIWVYVEVVTFALLPFLCLALSNAILAWTLARSVRQAGRSRSLTASTSGQAEARTKKVYSTTITVMVMSFVFLVLNLPLFAVLVVSSSYNVDASEEISEAAPREQRGDLDLFLQGLVTILMMCNSAVNFYLYCLTGTRFRQELRECFVCRRPPLHCNNAHLPGSSSLAVASTSAKDAGEEF